MMIETMRLNIHVATQEDMEQFIRFQTDDILKAAYTEMLEGCLQHPELWNWYAIWMIELKKGTHIGELCFKGLDESGSVEIGYGISKEYEGNEYATEAVSAAARWTLKQPGVSYIIAEVDPDNTASRRVLEKSGFITTGQLGNEGIRFILSRSS